MSASGPSGPLVLIAVMLRIQLKNMILEKRKLFSGK